MIYQWKSGTRYKAIPQKAAEVMDRLAKEGRLCAKELVEVSRPEEAPLHNEFEWDDTVAAEKWREHQGRCMIAALTVIYEDTPQKAPIRAFFHIQEETSNYEPVEVIIQSEDKQNLLIKTALKELNAFKAKYSGIKAFSKLFSVIDELVVQGD